MSRVVFVVTIFAFTLTYAEPSFARNKLPKGKSFSTHATLINAHHKKLPKGKPFKILYSLLNAAQLANKTMSESLGQMSLVQGQVDGVQGEVTDIQNQLNTVVRRVDAIEFQMDDFQDQFDVINGQIAAMYDQIGGLQSDMENLQWVTDDLSAQIASNAGDYEALTLQVADNQMMIEEMKAMIAALDGLVDALEVSRQGLMTGCPDGSSISRVDMNGSVVCETDDFIAFGKRSRKISLVSPQTSLLPIALACPAGTTLTGGGFSNVQGGLQLIASQPSGNSWLLIVANPTANGLSVQIWAQCGNYGPV
jgi:peptidoglycan hydrolase CwlO-like protein